MQCGGGNEPGMGAGWGERELDSSRWGGKEGRGVTCGGMTAGGRGTRQGSIMGHEPQHRVGQHQRVAEA